MLKLVMCVKRHGDLSREEFDTHWRNRHAGLVREHAAVLGIRRYIQTVPLPDRRAQEALQQGRGSEVVDFDGCAELWWDDLESHLKARETPEGRAALAALVEDERRFVCLEKSQLWYGSEREILQARTFC